MSGHGPDPRGSDRDHASDLTFCAYVRSFYNSVYTVILASAALGAQAVFIMLAIAMVGVAAVEGRRRLGRVLTVFSINSANFR